MGGGWGPTKVSRCSRPPALFLYVVFLNILSWCSLGSSFVCSQALPQVTVSVNGTRHTHLTTGDSAGA